MFSKIHAILSGKFFIGLLFCLAVSACNNSKEVSFKSAGVTQTFAQGDAEIPADFASYIYPGATTSGSVSAQGENDEQSKFLMLTCKDTADTVNKWYLEKLKSDKWKISNQQDQGKLISLTGTKGDTELSVMITEENGSSSISLSLSKQVEGNYAEDNNRENFVPNKDTPPTD